MTRIYKHVRSLRVVLTAVLLIAALQPLPGLTHYFEDCYINLELRNSAMLPLPQRWVKLVNHVDCVEISAQAEGYQSRKVTITKHQGQKVYNQTIILADLYRDIFIRNSNFEPIDSAYIIRDQFEYNQQDYGITLFLPIKYSSNLDSRQVQVFDDITFAPVLEKCTIDQIDDFHRLKLVVSRSSLAASNRFLMVMIGKSRGEDDANTAKVIADYFARLVKLEKQRPDKTHGLAEFIVNQFTYEELSLSADEFGEMPDSVRVLLQQKKKFEKLHSKSALIDNKDKEPK